MANENVFIKYLNNHGVDAVQLLSAKELARKTVLTDDEEVEAIVEAMMSRMSNYVTQSQLNAYTTYSQMTEYIQNNVQAFPEATSIDVGVLMLNGGSSGSMYWVNKNDFVNNYFSNIVVMDNLSNYVTSYQLSDALSAFATVSSLSNYATLSALSSYATLADISAFAPASALSSYITASALTQDYMPVWYGSQAAFDALPSSANPNKLYIIID